MESGWVPVSNSQPAFLPTSAQLELIFVERNVEFALKTPQTGKWDSGDIYNL